MADTVRVRIDVKKLAANLCAAEGADIPAEDVHAFLVRNKFVSLGGDVWVCEEVSLRLLDRSEILEVEDPGDEALALTP